MKQQNDLFFDLLEDSLQNGIAGYAITCMTADGNVKSAFSRDMKGCNFFELLGMIEQLKDELLDSARCPSVEHDDEADRERRH